MGHEGDNKQWGKLSCDSGILAKNLLLLCSKQKKSQYRTAWPFEPISSAPPPLFGQAWSPPPPPPPPRSCNGTPAKKSAVRWTKVPLVPEWDSRLPLGICFCPLASLPCRRWHGECSVPGTKQCAGYQPV